MKPDVILSSRKMARVCNSLTLFGLTFNVFVEYAQVLRMLGDGRLALQCYDDVARVGLIRGTMRRRVWINTGDIVLIGLREFQPDKADVIHKYTTEEARNLQAFGELPASARINQTAVDMAMDDGEEGEDMGFDFDEI